MSDTRKTPITNLQPGRRQPPAPPHLRRTAAAGKGDRAVGARVPGPDDRSMFGKHSPAMPDDPRWSARSRAGSADLFARASSAMAPERARAPRAEGSQVAPHPALAAHERATGAADPNQGEGDKVSARRYNEAVQRHVAAGKVEPAARAAKSSLEGAFAPVLAAAEAAGRAPARVGTLERTRGLLLRAVNRFERLFGRSKRR